MLVSGVPFLVHSGWLLGVGGPSTAGGDLPRRCSC